MVPATFLAIERPPFSTPFGRARRDMVDVVRSGDRDHLASHEKGGVNAVRGLFKGKVAMCHGIALFPVQLFRNSEGIALEMSQFEEFNERVERAKAKADREAAGSHHPVTAHRDRDLGFRWKFLEALLDVFGHVFAGALAWVIVGGAVVVGIAVTLGVSLKIAFGLAVIAAIAVAALGMSA